MEDKVLPIHVIRYPWQIEELYTKPNQSKYRTGFRGDRSYDEWQCAYIDENGQCPVMINNVGSKTKKRMYCEPHRILIIKIDGRARWKRWKARKEAEKKI